MLQGMCMPGGRWLQAFIVVICPRFIVRAPVSIINAAPACWSTERCSGFPGRTGASGEGWNG